MKRKFSFLTPLKVPSRSETKAHKENLSAKRLSPPVSPFINRRPLDPQTEAFLRAACAALVQDCKPSDNAYEADTRLDFEAFHRAVKEKGVPPNAAIGSSQSYTQARSFDAQQGPPQPNKYAYRPDASLKDLLHPDDNTPSKIQANISRRRDGFHKRGMSNEHVVPLRTNSSLAQHDPAGLLQSRPLELRPKTAPQNDSTYTSYSTPLSASTDRHFNYASTTMTSAALTPSKDSKRTSQSYVTDQAATARADAAAIEWMRQELAKRRQQSYERELELERERGRSYQPPPSRASRTSSRTRSIRDGIGEYFRPGSSNGLSRSASRDSSRTRASESDQSRSHGWRSWTLQRKSSKDSFADSRPGSSRGRSETCGRESRKKEVNLNRELPPLPSLDQWQEPQPSNSTHIAALMRPNSRSRPRDAPSRLDQRAERWHAKNSSYDSNKNGATLQPHTPRSKPRSALHSQSNSADLSILNKVESTRSPNYEPSTTSTEPPRSVKEARRKVSHHRQQSSGGTPTFPRKMSTETRFPNMIELSASNSSSPSAQVKNVTGLRKVFNGWMSSNKKKQATWMDKVEADGVKRGIMFQNGDATGAPVVRY